MKIIKAVWNYLLRFLKLIYRTEYKPTSVSDILGLAAENIVKTLMLLIVGPIIMLLGIVPVITDIPKHPIRNVLGIISLGLFCYGAYILGCCLAERKGAGPKTKPPPQVR